MNRRKTFKTKASNYLYLVLVGMLLLASSCIPNKKIVYFKNSTFNKQEITHIKTEQPGSYKLQPQDVLSVKVKTLDSESSAYFNVDAGNPLNINPASLYLSGYSIDDDGNIELPEVGIVNVLGLTVDEAQEKIKEAVGVYLNNSTVLVKLVSFKITVLGEVRSPGTKYIYNDQATVVEAIGMAGDLTDFGNRKNITLLRQTPDGMGAILIDINDPEMLSSKYFFLQPNDVLYVQAFKQKSLRSNLSSLGAIGGILSLISTAILISNNL